jgi:hypothetical protein
LYGPVYAIAKGASGNLRIFPNPVRGEAGIHYSLTAKENISLLMCDASGRVVSTLYRGEKQPGSYSVKWQTRNDEGNPLSSGVYFCILKTMTEVFRKKILIVE